jgi:hypothetical protein
VPLNDFPDARYFGDIDASPDNHVAKLAQRNRAVDGAAHGNKLSPT